MSFDYKKSLGQNFLKDQNIINKIVNSFNPNKKDLIVEIGPGAGALTRHLVKKDCDVMCFEIDTRLKEILLSINADNLTINFIDFLKVDLNEYIEKDKYENIYFIGNLPYYITTAIVNKITEYNNVKSIIIMVQKEVGERFMAKPHSKKYNSLSVFLQYNYEISKVCDVNKYCFEPTPKVDSVVIKLDKNKKIEAKNEEIFYKLIHDSFVQKRKNLRNNLKNYNLEIIGKALKTHNKDLTSRAEELSIEEFIDISNQL